MHDEQPMKPIFFYGLFMDKDLLKEKGLNPVDSITAHVSGYGLRIGKRATLENSINETTFGSLMRLSSNELGMLYGEKRVIEYVPQEVVATDVHGNSIEAISYILPMEKVSGRNAEYANLLASAARKIGLPDDYIKEIETWI
jgi:hypothetical protein